MLHRDDIGVGDNFFEIGGDSILCIQIVARCRKAGVTITPKQLFAHQTIAALAPHAVAAPASASALASASATAPALAPAPASASASASALAPAPAPAPAPAVPLTPIQRWFFATGGSHWHHDNQHVLLPVDASIAPAIWDRCLQALTAAHPAFHLRFRPAFTGVEARVAEAGPHHRFITVDLSAFEEAERARALAAVNAEAQSSFDLDRGPLLHAVHVRMASDRTLLLLVAHHLVVDGVSWRILLGDLETLAAQATSGSALEIGDTGTPFHEWAHRLDEWSRTLDWNTELAPWLDTAPGGASAGDLRRLAGAGHPSAADRVADEQTERFVLDAASTTALFETSGRTVGAPIDRVLLAGLVHALAATSRERSWWIDVESHGRDLALPEVDLARTAGWFTSISPVRLDAVHDDTPTAAIARVDRALRAVPSSGIALGLARTGRGPEAIAARLRALPECGVLFNYLGSFHQTTAGDLGGTRAPERLRTHPLVVEAAVVHGTLDVELRYSGTQLDPAKVRALAGLMRRRLLALATGDTTRFPAARVPSGEIAALVSRLEQSGRVADVYELTPMQGGMLFHGLYDAQGSVYFEQFSFVLEEPVDARALREAWRRICERHDAFRSAFFWEGLSRPLQVVFEDTELPWREEDWSALPAEAQAAAIEALRAADIGQGFDLNAAPLCRFVLARLGGDRCFFLWSHHHLLLDGWSLHQVFEEAFTSYRRLAAGDVAPVLPSPRFAGYIEWLQQQERSADETRRHWQQVLGGFHTPTPLPLARASADEPRTRDYRFREVELALTPEDTRAVAEFARRERLTTASVIQGLWALFLSRATVAP